MNKTTKNTDRDRYVYEILDVVVNYLIKHFSGVGSRHTEASPCLCNRCSRETYNYNTDLPLQHGPWERPVSRWLTHFWLIITTDFSEVYSHTPHTRHTHAHYCQAIKCSRTTCILCRCHDLWYETGRGFHAHTCAHAHTHTHTTAKQSNVLEQLPSCVDVMIYGMKQAEVFTHTHAHTHTCAHTLLPSNQMF